MTLKRLSFTILIAYILTGCLSDKKHTNVSETDNLAKSSDTTLSIDKQIQKTLKLNNGFEINVGQKEDYGKFVTYTLFILKHNNNEIYLENKSTEYEFSDKLYPIVRAIDKETFEVFVEVNDRPNKNYLKYFKVHQDKIIDSIKLPTFISTASNLDDDQNLEYAGFRNFGKTFGDNYSLTAYSPILYYEITSSGLKLDSTLTIKQNKIIYGDFKGFDYNEKIEMPIEVTKKLEGEIERISNTR